MVTKEILKREIDNVQEEYLVPLYRIIKTFEHSEDPNDFEMRRRETEPGKEDWYGFIDKFAGCLADTPIERGDQGRFEVRDDLI